MPWLTCSKMDAQVTKRQPSNRWIGVTVAAVGICEAADLVWRSRNARQIDSVLGTNPETRFQIQKRSTEEVAKKDRDSAALLERVDLLLAARRPVHVSDRDRQFSDRLGSPENVARALFREVTGRDVPPVASINWHQYDEKRNNHIGGVTNKSSFDITVYSSNYACGVDALSHEFGWGPGLGNALQSCR